jgi:hypothetical protein
MIRLPDEASAARAERLTPEVEPLGDIRWARIEQSLMDRLDDELPPAEPVPAAVRASARARARTWPVALVATFAACAAAAFALRVARPSFHASTSRVVTETSPSHMTIAENSLDVSPESGIVISEEEHATVLTLERGEVSLHVAPREKDRPFLVEAGDVQVRVVGTEFTVRRVGVGATVSVRKGVVEVREHGELALVRGGERWPSTIKDFAPSAPAAPSDSASPSLTALSQPLPPVASSPITAAAVPSPAVPPPPVASPPVASPPVASPPVASPPVASPPVASIAQPRHAAATVAQSRPAARKQGGATSASSSGSRDDMSTAAPPATPDDSLTGEPAAVATAPVVPATPSAQSRYEAAARIERSDPTRALRIYTGLAGGSDAWAQDALYAAGRLQADRGARTDAVRLLEEYLRRFPRGSNAQDARTLRESLR